MSIPPLFSLSRGIFIEIICYLGPDDIHACRQTCRQLNDIILESGLIQYTFRTALSGVYDTLYPGLTIPERLEALKRWETAWAEMDLREPKATIDAPVPPRRRPPVEFSFGRYFIVVREGYGRSAGYSFLDMQTSFSSHIDAALWTTIDINTPNVLVFAFASDLDLVVSISAPDEPDRRRTTLKVSPMSFRTGEPHPLASQPTFEVSVPGASAYILSNTQVIGDYILYWVGGPGSMYSRTPEDSLCTIYLIAWKEARVTELRGVRPGVYGPFLAVLSQDIVLLIRMGEPALELCRLSNIGGPNASLETVCILSLPELTTTASVRTATCAGEHPGHVLFLKDRSTLNPSTSTRYPEGRGGRPHLRPIPEDGIVSAVMHITAMSGYFRTIDLSVRCRTLLDFADGKTEAGTREGSVLTVPWEEWGPPNTRVLEHDSLTWGSLIGERRATVGQLRPTSITMRDFNPFRVRRALARTGGPGKEVTLECGSVIKVVDETSVYRGGEWFCDDIESSMPYVETVTPYEGCENVYMDEDNLVAEVRTETGQRKFFLHCL